MPVHLSVKGTRHRLNTAIRIRTKIAWLSLGEEPAPIARDSNANAMSAVRRECPRITARPHAPVGYLRCGGGYHL